MANDLKSLQSSIESQLTQPEKNYLQASASTSNGWLSFNGSGATAASVATISTDATAANLPRAFTTATGIKVLPVAVSNTVNAGTFTATSATPTVLTFSATGIQSGYVIYVANSGGALPTGLVASTPYWVTLVTATTAKISTSYANYLAGTFVGASSTGTGTQYYGWQGTVVTWTLDAADYNKRLKVQFDQNILSGATGDWQVDVYYNSSSAYTFNTYTRAPLSTDTSSTTVLPNLTGTFRTAFGTPGSAAPYMEIRFQNIAANTHALEVSDLVVGPGVIQQGPAVTSQSTYTTTMTGAGSKVFTNTTFWSRVGDKMLIEWTLSGNATAAGAGATTVSFSLPTGYTINTSALTAVYGGSAVVGFSGIYGLLASGQEDRTIPVVALSSTALAFLKPATGNFYSTTELNVANAVSFDGKAWVPINEWAGTGVVNISQNGPLYYSTSGTWDADSSTTVYGPAGQAIGGALTTVRTKTIGFSGQPLATDVVRLEVDPAGTGQWVDMIGASSTTSSLAVMPLTYTTSGLGVNSVGVLLQRTGATTYVVQFGRYYAASLDGSSVLGAWSDWSVTSARWRLAWYAGGQAVGFSNVTQTASGLVQSAGQLLGTNTNDTANAGNVGELLQSKVLAASATALTTNTAKDVTTITLTAGDWDVWGWVGITGTTTVIDVLTTSLSTTPNTLAGSDTGGNTQIAQSSAIIDPNIVDVIVATPMLPVTVANGATAPYHLVTRARFGSGTASAYGWLQARRRR